MHTNLPKAIVFASSEHHFLQCTQFKELEISKRFDLVKRLNLCLNCLSNSHSQSNCHSKYRCRKCSKRHHTLLHFDPAAVSQLSTASQSESNLSPNAPGFSPSTKYDVRSNYFGNHCSLGTWCFRQFKTWQSIIGFLLAVNFMTEEFVQALHLPRKKTNLEILSIGKTATDIKHTTFTTIKFRKSGFELPLSFCITSHIAYQPESEIEVSSWQIPSNIDLTDEEVFKSRRIDLLLGAENFFDILAVVQIKLGSSLPRLQKTLLGWVASGRCRRYPPALQQQATCLMSIEESIDENLQHLWKLHNVPKAVDMGTTTHGAFVHGHSQTWPVRKGSRSLALQGRPNQLSYHLIK